MKNKKFELGEKVYVVRDMTPFGACDRTYDVMSGIITTMRLDRSLSDDMKKTFKEIEYFVYGYNYDVCNMFKTKAAALNHIKKLNKQGKNE